MKIHGLQKLTLLDYPGKTACTIFLGWCDFRCPFCHNWELVDGSAPAETDDESLFKFLEKRKGILDGVAITGGEPMMNKDLPELISRIREMGYKVKCDTNGNHPDMLADLLNRGMLDYVAMDVKNSPERYADTIGLDTFDYVNITRSISLLINSNIDYEFRTTTVEELHNEDSFEGIGKWIEGAGKYYIQKFTDRDSVPFEGLHAPSDKKLRKYLEIARKYVPSAELRGVE